MEKNGGSRFEVKLRSIKQPIRSCIKEEFGVIDHMIGRFELEVKR